MKQIITFLKRVKTLYILSVLGNQDTAFSAHFASWREKRKEKILHDKITFYCRFFLSDWTKKTALMFVINSLFLFFFVLQDWFWVQKMISSCGFN